MTRKIETTDEGRKALCDQLIKGAVRMMIDDAGAPVPLILDRLLTFAAAQSCAADGKEKTAAAFRELAARIEAGALDRKGLQ